MKKQNDQAPDASENGPDMAGHSGNADKAVKSQVAQTEEAVLSFWQKNKIFEKSLEKPATEGEFIFYDGPPFATGTPHTGHFLPSSMKDVIPRYKTMRGFNVPRKWGWDCHGLPIENLIQKENNLNSKAEIEKFGIKRFSQAAKASVFLYDKEWRKYIERIGRWVDMDNEYTTMDSNFMESVWWAFSELDKKGLVYEDFRVMHISPLLETPLSNFEVNQAYKDITDISAYVKFELEDGRYLIAWTTTPWTLPGNVALAVGEDIEYVEVEIENAEKNQEGKIILAKALLEKVLKDKKYSVISEMKGKALVGKKYKPVFDYYSKNEKLENHANGWKVYAADFVTTEDGTGIVHIAPAFGEDDLNLGKAKKLPFVQHVNMDGTIKPEATDFAGRQAKPKATLENPNAHQDTDIEVIKYLAHNDFLFAKEKLIHSYPHCWRTDAPLLNYALSSWFVKVTDFKNKMVSLNKDVNWVPESIGTKRFGNWLENAKDWGISRSRFWGTTMPVWRSADGETEVIGSVEQLKERTKSTNTFYLMRHGEGDHNLTKTIASTDEIKSNLTEKGKEQTRDNALKLKEWGVDFIYSSPIARVKQTAEIVADMIGFDQTKIIYDDRLIEVQGGEMNGKSSLEYQKFFKNMEEKFVKAPKGGETLSDIRKRVGNFIYEINEKHNNKKVLIITHEYPIWMLLTVKDGLSNKKSASMKTAGVDVIPTGYLSEFNFSRLPHDDDYILDLHRPYIDEITYEKDGKTFKRIPEVFDTWFDSGSMPFAVTHYPFEKEIDPTGGLFKKTSGFPADFIAEGLDQTRGWFYTLLALNTALFGKAPFKNVVVNGLLLAEDGRKMSKSLRNYPDPKLMLDKYGADSIRYFLLASPLVRSESTNFSEKSVDEIMKKIVNRLQNVTSFYQLYVDKSESQKLFKKYVVDADKKTSPNLENVLDEWIVENLNQLISKVTDSMEKYELDAAARPINDFIDDLSTWYLRRSRDRFKGDDEKDLQNAKETTFYVLLKVAKVLAPFMPFLAEDTYQKITGFEMQDPDKSIHLESWPNQNKFDEKIIKQMQIVRDLVAFGLEARDSLKIRVRQPLQTLRISEETANLGYQMIELIKDEVNVKEVIFDDVLATGRGSEKYKVVLDSEITPELLKEGVAREIIRSVQSMRKNANLNPEDKIVVSIETDEEGQKLVTDFSDQIKKPTNLTEIKFAQISENEISQEVAVEEFKFKIRIG